MFSKSKLSPKDYIKNTLAQFKKELMHADKLNNLIGFWYANSELHTYINEQITLQEAYGLLISVYEKTNKEFFDIYIKNMSRSGRGAALIKKLRDDINAGIIPDINQDLKKIKLGILQFYLPFAEPNATPQEIQFIIYAPPILSSSTKQVSSKKRTNELKANEKKTESSSIGEEEYCNLLHAIIKKPMPENISLINMFQNNAALFEHLNNQMSHSTNLFKCIYRECTFEVFEAFVNRLNDPSTEKSIRFLIHLTQLDTEIEKDKKTKFLVERSKPVNESKKESPFLESDRPFKRARTDVSDKGLESIPNPLPSINRPSHHLLFGANAPAAPSQITHSDLDEFDIDFEMELEKAANTATAPVKQAQQHVDEKAEKWSPKIDFSLANDFSLPDFQFDDQPGLLFDDQEDSLFGFKSSSF